MKALNDALRESTHFHVDGQHTTLSLSLQVGVLERERERERVYTSSLVLNKLQVE